MSLFVPAGCDFHVHCRQDEFANKIAKSISQGGICTVLVMPNLNPPIVTTEQCGQYRNQLMKANPNIQFFMTLYLSLSISIEELSRAKESGFILGLKLYPQSVTTMSQYGVDLKQIKSFFHIFKEMERLGLVLNIHGEIPSNSTTINIMNAEIEFLETLKMLSETFPNLKIVMEHVSTSEAVDMIQKLNSNVAATITAHHLIITVDDWAGRPHNYCKPVAKFHKDRDALWNVIKNGNSKFFLGSDSAPHTVDKKECCCPAAGVFTSPILLPLLAHYFELHGCLDRLPNFISHFGTSFYGLPVNEKTVQLIKKDLHIPKVFFESEHSVVPFKAGEIVSWSLVH